ncbi:MAG: hypothetical protein PWQ25_1877 [Deferribacteres bacterium]|nr:hypothetical protein [Deferribacteraceae bacterium]MDK2793014.1 hypothetical protein [Deferribacteres bacterium]
MVYVKPFKGVRYNLEKSLLKNVIAPPYDVISGEMREKLLTKSPYNIVKLILPEGDDRYEKAAKEYKTWKEEGILVKDQVPAFYIYEQEYEYEGTTYVRTGFIGLLKLEELGKGKVFPHEKTLSGPKEDRFNLMKACRTNFSQIFGLYMDKENKLERVFSSVKKDMAVSSAVDIYGVKNTLWTVDDEELKEKIEKFMIDKAVYIADGHHRYETALNFKKYMRELNGDDPEDTKPYDYVMMMFVNFYDEGLKIFPTHRVIRIDENFDETAFLEKLKGYFNVKEIAFDEKDVFLKEDGDKKIIWKHKDKYYGLTVLDNVFEKLHPIYRKVNTYILQEIVLKEIMGFEEEKILRKDGIYFVQSEDEIEKLAKKYSVTSFLLKGIDIEIIRDISESGLVMPQKSTYFYPKLQTGLVINEL